MEYYIYLKLPSYLSQWLVHRHGGQSPIAFVRGSVESKMLQRVTVKLPAGQLPQRQQPGEIAIIIPYSKTHDPRTYNYITETGKRCLMQLIKNAFDVEVWEFLHDFGRIGKKQKDLIYLFMEQNGIQETGSDWDAIAKIYQRLRNIYLTKLHRQKGGEKYKCLIYLIL